MEQHILPKVLVIDVNNWRDDAGSNTLRDIFSSWDADRLAVIYTNSQMPHTEICHKYFQISESKVLKSIFNPTIRTGKIVENTLDDDSEDAKKERERYSAAHKKHAKWMRLAREIVWKIGHWKTEALQSFVKEFNPDLIFVPIFPHAYMGRIQKYIIRITCKPTVCYLADDNYSYDACQNWIDYIQRFWTRQYVGPLVRKSNQMFVIVDKEKEDTDKRFGTNSIVLTKSIDFTGKSFINKTLNDPLKFVYTGSLTIGRDRSIALIADAINMINKEKTKAVFHIYTQTIPDDQIMKHINTGASRYYGNVSHQEIQGIIQEADVVVFAESLNGKESNIAKLSFSTKITDYISNGKCVLAVGKKDIAPIDYFLRNDSAIIANTEESIIKEIERIVNNPELIASYGEKAFNCAKLNHEKEMMRKRFIDTMLKATK